MAHRAHRRAQWGGIALFVAAFLLYLLTLDSGLQPSELEGGDLITHQYAQVQARPGNAPGYPLYTMGGWLWFHGLRRLAQLAGTPLPNPIPILSSYSMLWALLALGLLYAIVCRLTRTPARPAGNWPLAWLVSAFYGVTYFFWYYATTTEQYTSAIAQTLAIVWVYWVWDEAQTEEKQLSTVNRQSSMVNVNTPRPSLLLICLAFLCGLALAHMLTVAFIVPPLVVAVIRARPQVLRDWRLVVVCIVAALLPLVSYAYVYVRGAAHPEWWGAGDWANANQWFWAFVSTAQGRDELAWGFQASCAFFDNGFPELIWSELSLVFVVFGLAGIALLPRRPAFVLYATLAIYLIFNWMYRCGNWYQVILPAYPLLLLGVAALFDWWQRWLERQWGTGTQTNADERGLDDLAQAAASGRAFSSMLRYLPHLLLIVAIGWRFSASWLRADSSARPEDTALARAGVLLDQPLPEGAGLFAPVHDALALDYLVSIWGIRPDLAVVSSGEAGERLREGGRVLSTLDAAPVLLSELPPDLAAARTGLSADWLQLDPLRAAAPAPPATRLHVPVVEGLTLAGVTLAPAPAGTPVTQALPAVDVTLFWEMAGDWPAGVGVSLRPMRAGALIPDPAGGEGAVMQRDSSAPLNGLLPPADGALRLVADPNRLPLPEGADGILLIVYRRTAEGFTNLVERTLAAPTSESGGGN